MNSAILGLYGVYFLLVGWNGNGDIFTQYLSEETQFVPWIVVLLVLAGLSSYSGTHDLVGPFIALAIIATLVTRYQDVSASMTEAYKFLRGASNG